MKTRKRLLQLLKQVRNENAVLKKQLDSDHWHRCYIRAKKKIKYQDLVILGQSDGKYNPYKEEYENALNRATSAESSTNYWRQECDKLTSQEHELLAYKDKYCKLIAAIKINDPSFLDED
jgi:hypothetical protein